jgi:hypothetical protein
MQRFSLYIHVLPLCTQRKMQPLATLITYIFILVLLGILGEQVGEKNKKRRVYGDTPLNNCPRTANLISC